MNLVNYRDSYYGSVLDPIHGDIKLSEIEKWCIQQPIFSRLRKIKQNTFLYYVFPSANHTRFEHSIGVMHVAGKIFDACQENFATGRQKVQKYKQHDESSFFDLSQLGNDRTPVYYQELRLAGLLHDLGHGPMSHLFDNFTIDVDAFLAMLENVASVQHYLPGFREIAANKNEVAHELISCLFVFCLIDELKESNINDPYKFSDHAKGMIDSISAERIIKMIEPHFPGLTNQISDVNGNDYTDFFSQIVTAFPIDADRMDYLLRDSYFSGATYGSYDINRIFASFQAMYEDKKVKICFKESGLDAMLRFIQSRSHLYNQVYFHKTNRAANLMLTYSAETYSSENHKMLNEVASFEAFKQFYIDTSDESFIKEIVPSKMVRTDSERQVIQDLINRKLFKRVWQSKIVLSNEAGTLTRNEPRSRNDAIKTRAKRIRDLVTTMNTKLKALPASHGIIAQVDYFSNETFKDWEQKSIKIARKTPAGKYDFSNDWIDAGKEFELANMIVCMVRIYIARTFHKPEEFIHCTNAVRSHLAAEIKFLEEFDEKCRQEDRKNVAEQLLTQLGAADIKQIFDNLPVAH